MLSLNKLPYENNNTLRILTVPGLYGSGPLHWQTRWESRYGFSRIEQANWNNPDYSQWAESLRKYVEDEGNEAGVVLVAHSLGCHLVVKSFPWIRDVVKGVFLVAPPDLNSGIIRQDLSMFSLTVYSELGVPGYLIYSEDDPYANTLYSEKYGRDIGVMSVNVGMCGHINSESNIGDWEEGLNYLDNLLRTVIKLEPAITSNKN